MKEELAGDLGVNINLVREPKNTTFAASGRIHPKVHTSHLGDSRYGTD